MRNPHDSQPIISCHALSGFSAPQTFKVVGFLKKQKVKVLIDSGSTHNFINKKLATRLNCFIYPAPGFQVLIADGGTISCSGKCHSIKISMGDYQLDTPMYVISMGVADIILGVQWLTTLGTIKMNFQDLFMRFQSEGKTIELRGLKEKSPHIVSSHQLQTLLQKGADGFVAQLCSLEVSTYPDVHTIIEDHSVACGDMWKGISPKQNHDHELHPFFDISYLKEERTRKLRTNTLTQYLIPWNNLPIEVATSEDEDFI
jgi:hypothetical protein